MNWGLPYAHHLRGKENPHRAHERKRMADKLFYKALDRLDAAKDTRKAAPENPPGNPLGECMLQVKGERASRPVESGNGGRRSQEQQGKERARMKKSLAERNEIVRAVRCRSSVVAWVTKKGIIIYNPHETKLTVLVGADGSILDAVDERVMEAGVDVPLAIVEGISGLAATDPRWDGREIFRCQNPDCPDPVRSMDETCYLNIWKRSRKLMN
jgi:hypothetical protein